jgi:methylthioribose-1-phosphate isomerase
VIDIVRAIKEMKTRAFGQYLCVLYAFILTLEKNKGKDNLKILDEFSRTAKLLNASRPTFPFKEITAAILKMALDYKESAAFYSVLHSRLNYIVADIRQKRERRALRVTDFLPDNAKVLTHCNVSGELVKIAEFARESNKEIEFFATETRPYFQGARLTAWELKQAGFKVTLIPDNAVAEVVSSGKVNCAIVGSDRSAANGDIANKVGTYQIARVCAYFNIPFYVLTQPSRKIKTGKNIPVEIRQEEEILKFRNIYIAPKGTRAFYPGFDITPVNLITQSIPIQ